MSCHRLFWALMALALPGAAAGGAVAAELLVPGSHPEVELATPALAPKLDLSLDAGRLQTPDVRPVPPADAGDTGERDIGPTPADKPLTFGLDVRTRHRVGNEIRADAAAPPSLGDEVKSAIDRSTFGVTGTYRF